PFTLLGILLAILVIVAFVLVALNASQAGASPQQTVVVAVKDLQPRIPITADALTTRSIPVPANYPHVYFELPAQLVGMVPLVPNATSLTVVASQCQAEVITWFLTYASLKYSLESYRDYLAGGEPAPDVNCKQITDARGVTLQLIQQSYPKLFS